MKYICERIQDGDESSGGIDTQNLFRSISEKGPLHVESKSSPYTVIIDATKCECREVECERVMFGFHLNNGLFKKYYLFDDLFLSEFDGILEFVDILISGCIVDTYGERLHIETLARNIFARNYSEVPPALCLCEDCASKIGADNLWRRSLVSQMCFSLSYRDELINNSKLRFDDEAAEWIERAFDAGYLAGRQFSEYYVKDDLEIDAVIGRGLKSARKKAGEKGKAASSSARTKRRMALLEAMETFAKRNPDMIAFGDREIARLSLPKCVDTDPTLWAQGRKQVGEYLDEIRRGEAGPDAKARYHVLFPPKTA